MLYLILVVLLWAAPVQAAVTLPFSEDYEVANVEALAARGWWPGFGTLDDNGQRTTQIVTAPSGRTGQVLRFSYQGEHVNDNNNDKIVVDFPATPEIYVRYYKRTDPIPPATQSTYYSTTSKQHYLKVDGSTSDGYPNLYTAHIWGARDLSMVTQNAVDTGQGGASNDYANGTKPMADGQWYCVEYHVKMNTPGVANGVQEIWTDGTQTLGRYDRNFRDAAHATAAFTNIEVYRQAAHNQYRYEDDFVIATTRIGCSGSPSVDTTPPSAVTGLAAASIGATAISLTHNASTDSGGAVTYLYDRCAGTACTNFTQVGSGTATALTDSNLTGSTLYRYRVSARDPSNNVSAVSSIVEATTDTPGAPAARVQTITDTFNRADGPLGANWDDGYTNPFGGPFSFTIVSNGWRVSALNQETIETYAATVPPDDQWAQMTLSAVSTPDGNAKVPGILLRAGNPGSLTGYSCRAWIYSGTPKARIEKWAPAWSALVDDNTVSWQAGDQMRCEAEGTALRLYRIRGGIELLVLSTTDSAFTSGRVGVMSMIAAGAASDVLMDDFVAGHFGTEGLPRIATSTVDATGANLTYGDAPIPAAITDDFNRVDAADLGATWDSGYTDSYGSNTALNLVGTKLRAATNVSDATESVSTALANDQYAQVTLSTATVGTSAVPRLLLRLSAPGTKAGYEFTIGLNLSFTSRIGRWIAGVLTTLTQEMGTTWQAGDVLRAEAEGTALRLYRNGTLLLSTTDATFASGRAGLTIYAATEAHIELDDFSAGDLTTTDVVTPTSVRVQTFSGAGYTDTVVPVATIAGGRTSVGADTFTRGDNASLGASWTVPSGYGSWAIATNAAQLSASEVVDIGVHADPLPENQWAQATLSTFQGAVDTYTGVMTRSGTANETDYRCVAAIGTNAGTSLERVLAGAVTYLIEEDASAWANGDTIRLESTGSTHRCYRNDTLILEATDSAIGSGQAGLWAYMASGGTPANVRLDNFLSGAMTPLNTDGRYTYTWPQTAESVCFFARDAEGVENTASADYQCNSLGTPVVDLDTTPPVISGGAPTTELAAGPTSITESVATDPPTRCRRSATNQAYAAMTDTMTTVNGLAHTFAATGLSNGTAYTTYVQCTDQVDEGTPIPNNVTTTAYSFSYSVAASGGDTTRPSNGSGLACTAISATRIDCTFTAATDNVAVLGYEGHLCSDAVCTTSDLINPTWSTSTTQSIVGLSPSTSYYLAYKAFDEAGNRSLNYSNVFAITTLASTDVTPPSDLTGLRIAVVYKNSCVLDWATGTDDGGNVYTSIERCTGADCTDFAPVSFTVLGAVSLTQHLAPTTLYRFRGKHVDRAGNASVTYSSIVEATTLATGLSLPRIPLPFGPPRSSGQPRLPRS